MPDPTPRYDDRLGWCLPGPVSARSTPGNHQIPAAENGHGGSRPRERLVAGGDASHRLARLGQVVQVAEELADGLGIVGIVERASVRRLVADEAQDVHGLGLRGRQALGVQLVDPLHKPPA